MTINEDITTTTKDMNNTGDDVGDSATTKSSGGEDVTTKIVDEEDHSSDEPNNVATTSNATDAATATAEFSGDIDVEKNDADETAAVVDGNDDNDGNDEEADEEDNGSDEDDQGSGSNNNRIKGNVTGSIKKVPDATWSTMVASWKLCWMGWNRFWARNPRTSAIIFRIIIPMSILLSSAMLGGWLLARYEDEAEYDSNDEIMVARKVIETLDVGRTADALIQLPISCIDEFFNETLDGFDLIEPDFLLADNSTNFTVPESELEEFINANQDLDITPEYLWNLREQMVNCTVQSDFLLDIIRRLTESSEVALAAESLSFNWGRCWNTSEYGSTVVWLPTTAQLQASKNQEAFYSETWKQNQRDLFELYKEQLGENATIEQQESAYNQSLIDATGRDGCFPNRAGTGWFFFTVMTTIGYGNQAPVTYEGRILTAAWGFVCIILFAAILGTTGHVIAAFYSDTVRRFNLTFLSWPIMTTVFWCMVALAWTVATAEYTFRWWGDRLEPEDQPDRNDAQWFAYISTTTVGLGDYYLPPDVLFLHDAFIFAFIFLAAFSLFAAFLTSLVDLISSFLPKHQDILEFQLAETNLIPGEKTIKLWIVRGLNLFPCINLEEPSIHSIDEGIKMKDEDGQEEVLDERTYVEKLTDLSNKPNKTEKDLEREVCLLDELLKYKQKQHLWAKFGFRKSLQKQKPVRHLDVDLGDESVDGDDVA
eukprot:CAMPEP_0113464224 /NCGR_PEP_ID=MMETSP0014_2-20120614/13087_1 /TAXON_ID=2857 /ORGANISM="Nitzschia sp." /LENGTH=709 /DNA_ID=CAMNT_0000356291 /DNA_START=95 /DNA_END=2224 /DNA_ORIENTATION=- /assembly_acc=CAM_ASM_000159